MTPDSVLHVDTVTKIYPTQPPVVALRGVSFRIGRGELVAIVGPSGSGKTTLLHLMGTLDRPTSGTVRVTGTDVAALGDHAVAFLRASRIGFVFQQFFLAEHQTVLDNVADGLLYAGVRQAERRRRAMDAIAVVGLAARANARGNGSPSPGLWSASPPSSWPTSPPVTSTSPPAGPSWRCSRPSTSAAPPSW